MIVTVVEGNILHTKYQPSINLMFVNLTRTESLE